MQTQDSTHPTGVAGTAGGHHPGGHVEPGNTVTRARNRKTNAALQMRLAGATWNEIALTLGYPTARTALVAVERALERELRTTGDRDALRRLASARLERLLRAVWPKAIDGDHPDQMTAVNRAKELVGQWSKLHGLDAPTEVVVHNPTQAEIDAWVLSVLAHSQPAVVEYDIIEGQIEGGTDAVPEPR